MHAWQFAKAQHVAERNGWTRFVSMQNHFNLLYREEEREMIPQCIDQGVGVIPWSPLARGFLTGTRTREGERRTTRAETDAFQDVLYGRPEDFDVIDRLNEVAAERFDSPAQVALAWLLHKPGITAPIVGATKLEHLEEAIAAANLSLSAEEIERLEEPYVPHPVLGPRVAAVDGPAPPARRRPGTRCSATSTCAPSPTTRPTPMPAPTHRARRGSRPVPPGGDLLDVPCGYGRHAIPLARAGYRVTGVDRSPTLLAEARRRAGDDAPELVEADYRELPFPDESFDAALNLFTSLGFYGDEEDVKALAEIGRVLRPTGRLVIETMHRDRLVHGFHEQDWRLVGEGRLLLEQRSFDAAAGVAQTTQTLIEKTGERDSRSFAVRVYTATELVAMLNRAGFDDARCYGDLDGRAVRHDHAARHRRPALTPARR